MGRYCDREIVKLEPHPNADRLQLCTVDLGIVEQTVATGAFNIAVDDRVPFINVGGRLPNGMVLEPRKMRGIVSAGWSWPRMNLVLARITRESTFSIAQTPRRTAAD